MSTRMHKCLLIMITLALAVAPMRALWAIPASVTTDTNDHCAQMQGGTQPTDSSNSLSSHNVDTGSDHACNGCCGSDCNAANCNACAHGASAASSIVSASPEIPASALNANFVQSYPERIITPPLRPPLSL